jgi:O-antigen/teichoic acid export membrane protein
LAKREIRTHYSGLIIFIAKLLTVATGIAYALMVANSLSQNEYGIFGTFNWMIPYFTLLAGPVTFWTMRFAARNKEGASKTGVVANLTLGAIATLIYLAFLPVVTGALGLQSYAAVYIAAAAQVIETYSIAVLEACLQAQRPHFVGYGLLIGEVAKVSLAYFFLMTFHLALLGVMLSIGIAYAIKIAFYFKTLVEELKQRIVFRYVREWIRGSAFNLYSIAGDRIAATVFYMLTIYGREIGMSYYYAALQIANVITYSSFLAYALLPKLLAEGKIDEATVSLKMVLMFAIPMTAGAIAIPNSYLLFLKVSGEYTVATPVLIILAFDSLISIISTIYTFVLYGIEKVDEKAKIPFNEVMRSRLFISFSMPYAHSAITLPTTWYALTYLAHNDPLQVATYVTGINTIGHLATFIVLYIVVRKAVRLKIPWASIGKYVAASMVMALMLFLAYPKTRSSTLIFTATAAGVYFALLIVLDKETRMLVRMILQTMMNKVRRKQES